MDARELPSQFQLRSDRPIFLLLQSAGRQYHRLPCRSPNRRPEFHRSLHAGRKSLDHYVSRPGKSQLDPPLHTERRRVARRRALQSENGKIYIDRRSASGGRVMQITSEMIGGVLELRIDGRLDNEAADDLLAAIDDVLRKGHHAALLDMRGVNYVSSAGLGALVRAQKRFQAIHGIFGVASSSPQVAEILQLTRLAKVLVCDPEEVREKHASGEGTVQPSFRIAAAEGLGLAIYDLRPTEKL